MNDRYLALHFPSQEPIGVVERRALLYIWRLAGTPTLQKGWARKDLNKPIRQSSGSLLMPVNGKYFS